MNENEAELYRQIAYDNYAGLYVKTLVKLFNKADKEEKENIRDYVYNSGRKSNLFKAEFRAATKLKPAQEGHYKGGYLGREALPLEFRRKKRKNLESRTE